MPSGDEEQAKPGDLLVWDGHYNTVKYSNIPVEYLLNDHYLLPLADIMDEDQGLMSMVFLGLLRKYPANGKFPFYKGLFEFTREHNPAAAIKDMDRALQSELFLHQAMYLRGYCYLQTGQKAKAYENFRMAASYGNMEAKKVLMQAYRY